MAAITEGPRHLVRSEKTPKARVKIRESQPETEERALALRVGKPKPLMSVGT